MCYEQDSNPLVSADTFIKPTSKARKSLIYGLFYFVETLQNRCKRANHLAIIQELHTLCSKRTFSDKVLIVNSLIP